MRRTYDGSNTAITVFAFGIEEHAYSYSGSGSSDTNTSNTYYYNLGGRFLGTWDGSSPTTTFLLTDTLGSVVSSFNNLASGAAVVLGNQAYEPYGNRRTQQGTIGTSKGFTGQYSDFLTTLDYYNARYYDPVTGVFLSADTVQGNAQGMDPYSYAGANPETNTDPTGQRFISGDTSVGSQTAVIEPNHVISIDTPGQGTTIISPYVVGPTILPNPSLDQSKVTRALSHSTSNQIHDPVQAACESSGVFGCNYGTHYAVHIGTMTFSVPGEWSSGNKADPGGGDYNVNNVNEEGLIDEAGPCSFTSQTKVATKQGEQTIGTIQVGEKVWAYNPQTKKMELQPVVHVWIHQDNDLVDLTITSSLSSKHEKATQKTNEVIHTNKKHPFLTVEKGFLPVGQIKPGMHVMQANGHVGVISGWKLVPGVMTMYNLEVAHDHTFTVGVGMWVVHNDCGNNQVAQDIAEQMFKETYNNGADMSHTVVGAAIDEDGMVSISMNQRWEKKGGMIDETALAISDLAEKKDMQYVGPQIKASKNKLFYWHAEDYLLGRATKMGKRLTGIGTYPRPACPVCYDLIEFNFPELHE